MDSVNRELDVPEIAAVVDCDAVPRACESVPKFVMRSESEKTIESLDLK